MTAASISAARADLCLDFANTQYWRGSDSPTEGLQSPQDLIAWCEGQATLDPAGLKRFAELWKTRPRIAEGALDEALALREVIYRLFSGAASGDKPAAPDFDALNAALAKVPARIRLHRDLKGYRWCAASAALAVPLLLAPVVWSAGDLLADAQLARVRACQNPKCRWLFVDSSKTGARRWCSMSSCGNRAKAHRHYEKTRQR